MKTTTIIQYDVEIDTLNANIVFQNNAFKSCVIMSRYDYDLNYWLTMGKLSQKIQELNDKHQMLESICSEEIKPTSQDTDDGYITKKEQFAFAGMMRGLEASELKKETLNDRS
jgi:hypothetical protein